MRIRPLVRHRRTPGFRLRRRPLLPPGPPVSDKTPDLRARLGRPSPVRSANQRLRRPQLQFAEIDHGCGRVMSFKVCRRHGIAGLCPTLVTQSAEALLHGFAVVRRACETDAEVARAAPACTWKARTSAPRTARAAPTRAATSARRTGTSSAASRRRRAAASAWSRWPPNTTAPCRSSKSWPLPAWSSRSATPPRRAPASATPCRRRPPVHAPRQRLSRACCRGTTITIWEQLAADELWASVICDGHHLPPAVVRCILRVKTPARTILTCDASSLAGLPPGRYTEWGQTFEVLPSGKSGRTRNELPGRLRRVHRRLRRRRDPRMPASAWRDAVDMARVRPRNCSACPTSCPI